MGRKRSFEAAIAAGQMALTGMEPELKGSSDVVLKKGRLRQPSAPPLPERLAPFELKRRFTADPDRVLSARVARTCRDPDSRRTGLRGVNEDEVNDNQLAKLTKAVLDCLGRKGKETGLTVAPIAKSEFPLVQGRLGP